MKRLLPLILLTSLGASPLFAQQVPTYFDGNPVAKVGPQGKLIILDDGLHAPMVIQDFVADKQYKYNESYSSGSGNCISANGIIVGYNTQKETPAYWENGAWNALPIPSSNIMAYANGITPDGSMIVGNFAPPTYSGDYEGIMQVPCYWVRQADGSYSGPLSLPYPHTDFSQRSPQYVTAVMVSDNGKIIAGQMRDYKGRICQPLIYTQNVSGEWEYKLLVDELFHPEGLTIPQDPGDGPTERDVMTPEEIQEYEDALRYWAENSPSDYESYPNIEDFLTPEEKVLFTVIKAQWQQAFDEFEEAMLNYEMTVPNFSYNNVFITSDGTKYATTDQKFYLDIENDREFKIFVPYVIDITTDTYQNYPEETLQITVSGLADNGTVLGQYNNDMYGIYNGFILLPDATKFTPIYEYVEKVDPPTASWMKENMTHTYEEVDMENWQFYPVTTLATGIPVSNSDLSYVGFGQNKFWITNENGSCGYFISLPDPAGVEEIISDIDSNDGSYTVFNLQGHKVLKTKEASELSNLPKGIYIINGKKVLKQ
ncbi:MAG: T9SS type A sorting domain-containing protein [Muribaculaceae bacterium]|nr:T9SS type A sorting domain-containing protein [Muribaculaceae bacterium]